MIVRIRIPPSTAISTTPDSVLFRRVLISSLPPRELAGGDSVPLFPSASECERRGATGSYCRTSIPEPSLPECLGHLGANRRTRSGLRLRQTAGPLPRSAPWITGIPPTAAAAPDLSPSPSIVLYHPIFGQPDIWPATVRNSARLPMSSCSVAGFPWCRHKS